MHPSQPEHPAGSPPKLASIPHPDPVTAPPRLTLHALLQATHWRLLQLSNVAAVPGVRLAPARREGDEGQVLVGRYGLFGEDR